MIDVMTHYEVMEAESAVQSVADSIESAAQQMRDFEACPPLKTIFVREF